MKNAQMAILASLASALVTGCAGHRVTLSLEDSVVYVFSNGEPFATVQAAMEPRPYIWPLFAPGGVPVTRDYPMGEREHEHPDHPHHQSLWLAHGSVNGFDFWHSRAHRERIVLQTIGVSAASSPYGVVDCEYLWLADDETVVMNESRQMRFGDDGIARTVDVLVTFRAVAEDVLFGDTKEGTFAMRVHPALRVDGEVAVGELRNSEGQTGKAVWGKRARWIDDSGVVDGESVGVAIFDHPQNLQFPTWWHARTYGLLAANPFGARSFEKRSPVSGEVRLKKGQTLSLRYRVVLHAAGWDADRIDAAYEDWANL